jgi:hypothetical protein
MAGTANQQNKANGNLGKICRLFDLGRALPTLKKSAKRTQS